MKEQILAEFRAAYREAYKGILSPSVLEEGNAWFESFLTSALERVEKEAEKRGRQRREDELLIVMDEAEREHPEWTLSYFVTLFAALNEKNHNRTPES